MKKIIGIFGLFLTLIACNDGDVKVQNISFEQITITNACNNNYFKINGNEMLLMRITDPYIAPFPNQITTPANGTTAAIPRVLNINSNNKVIYRNYSSTPVVSTICDSPPPANPTVIEEWNAIGGTIEITTTPVFTAPDATTHATRITGYNNYIVYKNLIFQKPTGTQAYGDDFRYGNYFTPTTLNFPSASPTSLINCGNAVPANTIFSQNLAEGFSISSLTPTLIVNSTTTVARTASITATNNILNIKTFNANLPANYFCSLPSSPTVIDTWTVNTTIGSPTIEVTTTFNSGIYTHKIHIKNATIKKSGNYSVSFYLGDDYYLGDVTTQ